MKTLKLDREELVTLKKVLETDIAQLRVEIRRTNTSEFRELLKHKEKILEKIHSAIPVASKSQ